MKKVRAGALCMALVLAITLVGCNQTADIPETVVTSYVVMPTAFSVLKVYLSERVNNGSLAGEALGKAKAQYLLARGQTIIAGDVLAAWINDPKGAPLSQFPLLLNQAATVLADLVGGKVIQSEPKAPYKMSIPPPTTKALAISANKLGYTITPDQIALIINVALAAGQLIVNQVGNVGELTADQKAGYVQRIKDAQAMIPVWE